MDHEEYEVKVGKHLADLMPSFMDTRRKELEALNNAFSRGDDRELRRLAHMMKGVGESYGFPRITALGAELDEAIKRGDHDAVASYLLQYGEYLGRVRIRIEE